MDYDYFYIGEYVRWNDPAIADYDENEREQQLNRVYEVIDINGDIITIADDFGEAEVFANELEHFDDNNF